MLAIMTKKETGFYIYSIFKHNCYFWFFSQDQVLSSQNHHCHGNWPIQKRLSHSILHFSKGICWSSWNIFKGIKDKWHHVKTFFFFLIILLSVIFFCSNNYFVWYSFQGEPVTLEQLSAVKQPSYWKTDFIIVWRKTIFMFK